MTDSEKRVTRTKVAEFTGSRLNELEKIRETGSGKATLAKLRQGIGHAPGDLPLLWGSFLSDIPEEMLGSRDEPGYAEWAVYTALTLYALHQQGIHGKSMNQPGTGLGSAMASLIGRDEGDRDRITRRFNIVATSSDMKAMAYNLRGVVQLLRRDEIALDYAQLAADLFQFQFREYAEEVRLKWGRDFYRIINKNTEGKGDNNEQD